MQTAEDQSLSHTIKKWTRVMRCNEMGQTSRARSWHTFSFFFALFFCSSMKMVTGRQKNDQVKFCGSGSISKRALFREITLRNLPHLDFEPDYVKSNRKTKRNIRGAVNDKSIWGSYKTVLQIPVLGQLEEVLVRAKLLLYEIYTNFFFPLPTQCKICEIKSTKQKQQTAPNVRRDPRW